MATQATDPPFRLESPRWARQPARGRVYRPLRGGRAVSGPAFGIMRWDRYLVEGTDGDGTAGGNQ
ncbi:MAG: hypothetical protein AVDCRST_MAG73-973 [uncultured Thermomicrobiales bacterium]|uniref:Uncharacterized protein n=1 Tax=uncultured Thermomicrobiales bacterium TaxID=1645740 RepID=A0A6J4TU62_9BACT|nr:MAG: hypothetical protein AVDCRST_MAG73-973 [uncultured Thermomicrobiales bacterium]